MKKKDIIIRLLNDKFDLEENSSSIMRSMLEERNAAISRADEENRRYREEKAKVEPLEEFKRLVIELHPDIELDVLRLKLIHK